MSGELFVEYQLAVKKERSDLMVTMADNGDLEPEYIGAFLQYKKGGCEVYDESNVSPEVETFLFKTISNLLSN